MSQNTSPIFGLTPNVGTASLTTTGIVTGSNGGGLIGTNMFVAFVAGPSGSFVNKIRFSSVSVSPLTGVTTVLRTYLSTQTTGLTSPNNTFLVGEISVPAIPSGNSNNSTNFYELPLNFAIEARHSILVSQHTAQTSNQNWIAVCWGSDY